MLKRNIHQMDITFREMQEKVDEEKGKRGFKYGVSLREETIRNMVKEFLKLDKMPDGIEVKEHLMDIYENQMLYHKFIENVIECTSEETFPKRLEITERTIIENHNIFKVNPIKILDVGVGGTYAEHLKAITTIELHKKLLEEKIQAEIYGGDIRIDKFEMYNGINLFPLDIFKAQESLITFYNKYKFNKFDVIRCSNLLGHFQDEKKEIIIQNLIEMSNDKSLILFNREKELVYTLYLKNRGNFETHLVYYE